jgi:prophage antirepressor-like protein
MPVAPNINSGWPIHQVNVDESEIWLRLADLVSGLGAAHGEPRDLVTRHLHFAFELHGEQHLIFHDHDFQCALS